MNTVNNCLKKLKRFLTGKNEKNTPKLTPSFLPLSKRYFRNALTILENRTIPKNTK